MQQGRDVDPVDDLGFGISAFLSTLWSLFLVYILLSVHAIVLMAMYKKGDFLMQTGPIGFKKVVGFTMGNLGFA